RGKISSLGSRAPRQNLVLEVTLRGARWPLANERCRSDTELYPREASKVANGMRMQGRQVSDGGGSTGVRRSAGCSAHGLDSLLIPCNGWVETRKSGCKSEEGKQLSREFP